MASDAPSALLGPLLLRLATRVQQLLIAPPYNPPQNDQDMSRTFGQPGAEAQADHHHHAHHQQHVLLRKLRWLLADQERGLR